MRLLARLPLALRATLLVVGVLHTVGLTWGMPSSASWEVDGVAPRDFLPGLAAVFTPGSYHTYPPLHLALLSVLTLPVSLAAALRAGSTSPLAVLPIILEPQYMTAMTITARVVAVLMSLAIVLALALVAEEIAPPERKRGAALGACVFAGVGSSFTYYAKTSNLDVPYLFWASLATLACVRAIARREPCRLRAAAVLAALAVGTKDQAYAMFVIGVPLMLVAWAALDPWARREARPIAREALIGLCLGALVLLVVDGVLWNPSGFRERLRFLSGSASADFATYSADLGGRLALGADLLRAFRFHYPEILAPFVALGAARVAWAYRGTRGPSDRARAIAAFVPLAAALSFTVAFNMIARRTEERFTLPQALLLAVYGGIGLDLLWSLPARAPRAAAAAARAACVAAVGWGLWDSVVVDANLLADPRYEAERFLDEHVRDGDVVEVHGLTVYLLRPPRRGRVERVGTNPPERRGPVPGVVEVTAPLGQIEARRPRFVVVNECYVWRFLQRPHGDASGRVVPDAQRAYALDPDATAFFEGLLGGRLGYRLAHEARTRSALFPRRHLHASVGCPILTFERDAR